MLFGLEQNLNPREPKVCSSVNFLTFQCSKVQHMQNFVREGDSILNPNVVLDSFESRVELLQNTLISQSEIS